MDLQRIKELIGMLLLLGLLLVLAGCSQENIAAKETLAASYAETYGNQVFWAGEEPDQPQVGDVRLESMTLLGETDLEKGTGALYEVTKSVYGQQAGVVRWVTMEPGMEVLVWPQNGGEAQVLTPNFPAQGLEPEQIIRQTVWGLLSWEVSLWREGHDQPIGIGTPVSHILEESDGQEIIEVMGEGYGAPIYQEGDRYELHGCQTETLIVNCYHTQSDDRCHANHITCTHPDLVTPRGIHVGSTREEVQAAYPEANNAPYWDWQGDYLCYRPWDSDFGPAILFVFQVRGEVYDTVQSIFLVNMVD